MKRSQVAIAAMVIVAVAAAAVVLYRGYYRPSPSQGPAPGENQVDIQGYAFNPSLITVSVGTTVTWTNLDSVVHTVTSTGGPVSFDSGNLSQGQTWQFTFAQAGTYTYRCTPHSYMTGTVIVQ